MNNIEYLLEQYFEGRTSVEDEAMLRRFFISGDVPESLAMYKPLFVYFDDERKATKPKKTGKKFILWLSGAAACAAILIGTFVLSSQQSKCTGDGDYVIIDGRCYTDAKIIRTAMLNTMREIWNNDESFSEDKATQIIESQLKEFDSLFDE